MVAGQGISSVPDTMLMPSIGATNHTAADECMVLLLAYCPKLPADAAVKGQHHSLRPWAQLPISGLQSVTMLLSLARFRNNCTQC